MDFPAEVVELIIDNVAGQRLTLKSCTLVSGAWHTRAKFWLFSSTPIKVGGVPGINAFIATLNSPLCTVHSYIRSLSLRHSSSNPSFLNPVIPVLVRLSNLTSLEIIAENALLSDEARALLQSNFPSLQNLLLRMTFATCADAVGLVCSFTQLECLRLYARWIGSSAPPNLSLPLSLHTLDLDGFLGDALGWLLSSPPSSLSSLQLREVATGELGIVFQYTRFVAASLRSFKLSFLDLRAERDFLEFDFDPIYTPELRTLEITGRDSNDAALTAHMLSKLHTVHLGEISFTNFISVNSRQLAWAQLEHLLTGHMYVHLRKVSITVLPHLRPGIELQLRRLHERGVLEFVFPEGF